MKKTVFNWMMALALVAVPMMFAACGDDDSDDNGGGNGSGGEQKETVFYTFNEGAVLRPDEGTQEYANLQQITTTMYKALEQALGSSNSSTYYYAGTADDSTKVILSCNAAYEKVKNLDLGRTVYTLTLKMGLTTLRSYVFGHKAEMETISFESQTLNDQLFWIGDQTGTLVPGDWGNTWTCTYTESWATVNTTFAETYWSGFAISARTDTTFAELTPDQYNNVTGKAYDGNNFLVVQQAYGNECISFEKPVLVQRFYYTNSAYTVNSILHGDQFSGDKFNEEDWLKCTVTGYNGDQKSDSVVTIDLASNGTYVNQWKAVRLSKLGPVTKITFAFSGSRTSNGYLNTPAYMCLDRITLQAAE